MGESLDRSKQPDSLQPTLAYSSPPEALQSTRVYSNTSRNHNPDLLCHPSSQGAYYSENARLYGLAKGVTKEEATGYFGSIFAVFYLGFEVLLKIIGSLVGLYATGEKLITWSTYTHHAPPPLISLLSPLGPCSLRP